MRSGRPVKGEHAVSTYLGGGRKEPAVGSRGPYRPVRGARTAPEKGVRGQTPARGVRETSREAQAPRVRVRSRRRCEAPLGHVRHEQPGGARGRARHETAAVSGRARCTRSASATTRGNHGGREREHVTTARSGRRLARARHAHPVAWRGPRAAGRGENGHVCPSGDLVLDASATARLTRWKGRGTHEEVRRAGETVSRVVRREYLQTIVP